MRARSTTRTALATLIGASALLAWPAPARSQEAQPTDGGFGSRDSLVVSVERIFGFQTQEFGGDDDDDSQDYDSLGMSPIFWGNVGIFSVSSSGLTFGTTLGVGYLDSPLFDDDTSFTLVRLGPRIGYAGSTQTKWFGYWLRGGPSALIAFVNQDSDDPDQDDDATTYAFAISAEAYAVITPVPHFGLLIGPHADIHIFGDSEGEDFKYQTFGLTLGFMGEFW